MRVTRTDETPIGGVYIAPIINVAFVLVIVLMIVAPIVNIPSIPVELPEAVTKESKEQNVTISYSKDGRLAIDAEEITWEELVPKVRKKIGKRRNVYVIVRADKEIPFGKVEKIFDILVKKVRARRVAVATKQKVKKIKKW
ncbi:biopolymer transporter ExbD [bacterium]|nr:biopolymer transporter ExbD [bacterium]